MTSIERSIVRFHRRLEDDEHHRYRSWGHCFRWFRQRNRIRSEQGIEHSALQLGFYLASWGMYRGSGSGFLLWKDYRIHRYAVRELLKPEYDRLLHIDFDSPHDTKAAIPLIGALVAALRTAYVDHAGTVNGRRQEVKVTDTLATKILYQRLAGVTKATASRDLEALTKIGVLRKVGTTGKGTHYTLAGKGLTKGSKGSSRPPKGKGLTKGSNDSLGAQQARRKRSERGR